MPEIAWYTLPEIAWYTFSDIEWYSLGEIGQPERLSSLRHVATIESIGSSTRIEGVKLSDLEIENLLSGLNIHSFRSRDEQEVAGYAEAMDLIFHSYAAMPITENHIKQLHGILLRFSDKDVRHRGEYKKFPNHVEAFDATGKSLGVIFHTATPFETPAKMQELVSWFCAQVKKSELHILLVTAVFVVLFLAIHPFQDGNGRLSRIITTWMLLQAGYTYVPYSSLEKIIEENKDSYYATLRRAQATLATDHSQLGEWLVFLMRCLHQQKDALMAKLATEKLLASLPPLSLQIVEFIRSRGASALADIVTVTHANRNTIKLHLKKLVSSGHLIQEGKRKGTRYR